MKLTLKSARDQLYDAAVPNLDTQENIDTFNRLLNFAQERLINSGKWTGMLQKVTFQSPESYISLPRRMLSLLALRFQKDNGAHYPQFIQNQWYGYQVGQVVCNDASQWVGWGFTRPPVDMGDGFVIFRDSPYDTYTLRWEVDEEPDIGAEVFVKGYNADGLRIFTVDGSSSVEGVEYLLGTPKDIVYSGQLYFVMKPLSVGYVRLYAVDTVTSEETLIGNYEPSEEIISYRRYAVPCEPDYVEAIAKIRYVPAIVDTDEVWPSNLGALRNAISALKYEENGDHERYLQVFQRALQLLNDEASEDRGGAKVKLQIDPAAYQMGRIWQGY